MELPLFFSFFFYHVKMHLIEEQVFGEGLTHKNHMGKYEEKRFQNKFP